MKKSDAVQQFKALLPENWKNDITAWQSEFSLFIDGLQRDGQITMKQAANWDQPAWLKNAKPPQTRATVNVPKGSRVHRCTVEFLEAIGSADIMKDAQYLFSLERRAQRIAENECSTPNYDGESETNFVLASIKKRWPAWPWNGFFLNGDPRGYGLKFDPEATPSDSPARLLVRDFGGYFIPAYRV